MIEIDTCHYLTRPALNSNIFTPEKNQIALPSLLPAIKFRQWHLTDKILQLTNNVNVAKYASLIGTLPVMGKYAYQIPHAIMAEKFGIIFDCSPPAPQTVAKWEKIMVELKLLEIPRHMLWGGANKSKLRVFTDKFWNMARSHCREKLSYTCPPSTLWRSPSTIVRKEYLHSKEQTDPVNSETPVRARDVKNDKPARPPAAHANRFENIKRDDSKQTDQHVLNGNHIAALKRYPGKKRVLPAEYKQVLHWILQNHHVRDELAGLLFFADLVRARADGDELVCSFFRDWNDLTPVSKLPRISELLSHMREVKRLEKTQVAPDTEMNCPKSNDIEQLISAICMDESYHGPLQNEYRRLAALPFDEQSEQMDLMLTACG